MVKRLKKIADYVYSLSDDVEKLTDERTARQDRGVPQRVRRRRDARRTAARGVRGRPRGVLAGPDQRHFDVQIMGGAALHFGNIAEMKTGEGKTLTCVLPAYLNAISGDGVHVVTVNDYLAKRDSEWMGRVHRFLGLDVGVILAG